MKTNPHQRLLSVPGLACALGLLAAALAPAHAASYVWDGTTNNWSTLHWTIPPDLTLVTGPTAGGNNAAINAGMVIFPGHDTFGNGGTTTSPAITLGAGATLASQNSFTTIWGLTLNGGAMLCNGGANANYPAFQLAGTLTVGGSQASAINLGSGNFSGVSIGGNGNTTLTLNVADATGSSAADLVIYAPLWNNQGLTQVGHLTKTGAGTLSLAGTNVYTGSTYVSAGTLLIPAGGVLDRSGLVDPIAGGTMTISGTVNITNGVFAIGASTAGTGTMNIESGGVVNVGNGASTVSCTYLGGKIANGGTAGLGILNLNGGVLNLPPGGAGVNGDGNNFWLNPYANGGATTLNLNAGLLNTARGIADGGSGASVLNFNGGTFKSTFTAASALQNNLTINVRNGGAIIDTTNVNISINRGFGHSAIGGDSAIDGGMVKLGTGTLALQAGSTFNGNLLVSAGTLSDTVQANTTSPSATGIGNMTTVGRTATVRTNAALVFNNSDAMGSFQYKTPVLLIADGGTIANGSGRFMSIGDISLMNGGSLSTVNGAAAAFQAFNLRGSITVSGATKSFLATSGTANHGVHLGGTTIPATTFNVGLTGDASTDLAVSVPLLDEVYNGGSLRKMGAGRMTLSAAASYTGPTLLGEGSLIVATGGSIAAGSTVTVSNAATLAITGSGAVNSATLVVNPGGVLDVSGASPAFSYTGGMTLRAGRPSSPATDIVGAFTLAGGAVNVGGTGTAATLSLANDLNLNGGTVNLDLSINPLAGNDTIASAGTVTLSSPTTIAVNQINGALGNGTYTLVSGASVVGGTNNVSLTGVGGGLSRQTFTLTNTGTALQLIVGGTAASLLWTAQTDSNWNFVTLNWTNLGTLAADTFFDSDVVTFDDSALSGLVNVGTTLAPGLMTFNNSGLSYDVGGAGAVSGLSLVKSGNGSVSFTNSGGLAFSSGITLNGGSLTLNNGGGNSFGGIGINGGTLAFNSGTLGGAGAISFAGSGTLQWLSGNTQDISARLAAISGGATATFDVGANNVTAATAINGAGHWTKTGAGTLTVSTNNSTLTGDITVQQGILNVTGGLLGNNPAGSALGVVNNPARSINVSAGAQLVFGMHDTFGNGGASPKLALNISGVVTNAVVPGFSGAFNTLGPVTLNGGTLSGVGGANANFQIFSLLSSVTVTGTSPSFIVAGTNANNGIHLGSAANSMITFDVADVTGGDYDLFVQAALINRNAQQGGGAGGLIKAGAGKMALWAANTYTGPTAIQQGTLSILPGGSIASAAITIIPGGVLDATALGGGFVLTSGQTLTAGRASSPATDIDGSLVSSGAINVAGTGTNGTLSIAGGLSLTGGTLNLDLAPGGDVIALSGPINLSGTTVVQPAFPGGVPVSGTYTLITGISSIDSGGVANLALAPSVASSFRVVTFDATSTPGSILLTLDSVNGSLVWQGTNGNNWDAATTVNWDNAGLADKFFHGDSVLFSDASFNGSVTLVGALQPATVVVSNTGTAYAFSGSGTIAGTNGLIKKDAGSLAVAMNNNSFAGDVSLEGGTTTVAGGLLLNPAATALGASGGSRNIFVNAGATLKFSSHDPFGNAGTTNQRKLNVNGGVVQSDAWVVSLGPIVLNGGTITANGGYPAAYPNNGTFLLNGNVTVSGSAASVMNDTGAAHSRYLLHVSGGATVFDVADVTGSADPDLTISTSIANGWAGVMAGITKLGTGTMVLSSTNLYTGTTTVSNGTLRVDGTLAGDAVVSGGTLGGNGTIAGPVTVQAGGTLAVGASIGALTLNSSPVLEGAVVMEVNKTNSPNADKLSVNAALVFGGALTVLNTGETLAGGELFDLFDASSFSGGFVSSNLPTLGLGMNWWLGDLTTDGSIRVNNAPMGGFHSMGALTGEPAGIATAKLLLQDSDANGDALVVTGVSANSTNGGTVSLLGGIITYTSVPGFIGTDAFTYTLSDGRGGSATATVLVNVVTNGPGYNRVSAETLGNGDHRLSYRGIPFYPYALDATDNLTPPVIWTPMMTNQASATGELIFTNTPMSNPAFYRTRHVP